MVKQKKNIQEIEDEPLPIAIERSACKDNTRSTLEEIKTWSGVKGYILENTNSATLDIDDPSKVTDYAILSSSTFEAGTQLAQLLNLGNIKNISITGKDSKTIHLRTLHCTMSIFVDKDMETKKILEKTSTLRNE
jgi:predicted regulator of Ras-like GTPase activity (Roadblock/LC7/MglB family)